MVYSRHRALRVLVPRPMTVKSSASVSASTAPKASLFVPARHTSIQPPAVRNSLYSSGFSLPDTMVGIMPPSPWYTQGLNFTCTGCGACCTGAPGFTWLDAQEADAIAHHLGLSPDAFRQRYTRSVHRNGAILLSLTETRDGACSFYKNGVGCSIYPLRPRQCRTWPFWRRIIASPATWQEEAAGCPGMNHGALHTASEIASIAADDGLPG